MNNLTPKQLYWLKWSSLKPNGQIHNMIVLQGEFVKHYNNTYCEDFINYKLDDTVPPPEFFGSLLTEQEEPIAYPFDDPLYPYSRFFKGKFGSSNNIGLFRIISIRTSVYKGTRQPYRDNNPYLFINSYTLINTPQIQYEETLMWVDLNQVDIIQVINQEKLVQNKAVDTYSYLPEDVRNCEIKPAL